jgi:predicted amidohydrolase YtcJ
MQSLAITNGLVWTGSREAEAVLVTDGRVRAVGSNEDVLGAAPPDATIVDVEGRRVVPGLIDSHTHFVRAGLTWNDVVRWDDISSLAEGLERIRLATRRMSPGSWIRVMGGWHPGMLAERRGPTRADLDEAAPHHPVYVQLLYEEAVVNSVALRSAFPDPASVEGVELSEDGSPTGRLLRPAAFRAVIERFEQPSLDGQVASTEALGRDFASLGVTGVIDPGGFGVTPDSYHALFAAHRTGRLPVRVRLYLVPSAPGRELDDVRTWVRYIHPRFGDDMVSYIGMGEVLAFGCHDMEGVRPHRVTEEAKRLLAEITRLLVVHDWPIHLHAILDETISEVLEVWEEIDRERPISGRRFSLAHAEPIGDTNLRRAARLGLGIAVQDRLIFRAADSARMWGEDVLRRSPPLRDILELGIPLGAGTDATVVAPHDPWRCIWWLVTGESLDGAPPRDPRHRLTVTEALTAYTVGSAWFSFEEGKRGMLEPGYLADLAVLDRDPFRIPPDSLPGTRSALTLVGGQPVYVSAAFSGLT